MPAVHIQKTCIESKLTFPKLIYLCIGGLYYPAQAYLTLCDIRRVFFFFVFWGFFFFEQIKFTGVGPNYPTPKPGFKGMMHIVDRFYVGVHNMH